MEKLAPEIMISEEQLQLRVEELAKQITQDFQGRELIVICVLKGAFMFCSDLVKKIELPLKMDFVSLSSYGDSTTSSGKVKVIKDIDLDIEGKEVLIVEDIVDTGLTLSEYTKMLNLRNPKSINIATLLLKPSKVQHDFPISYIAFEIEDKFVIGYGLDYAGRYRELPFIGVLNESN